MIRKGRQDVQQNGIKRNKGRLKDKRIWNKWGGGQDVLGRDVSGWIIKYLPYSYKYFSGPRKRGLSLFIRFPNESKTSNVIIHSYTEKICIKMDPMITFSSPCVRNNTQYTPQQNYAQFCIPQDG